MKADTGKVVTCAELMSLVAQWRRAKMSIVFTNGVFDILHIGHLDLLKKCSGFADRLVVGVNSDRSAQCLAKGEDRPFIRETDRVRLIAALAVVDAVVIFDEETPRELIASLKPDVLVKGADYKEDEIVGREFSGRTERVEVTEGYSTSSLLERIRRAEKDQ